MISRVWPLKLILTEQEEAKNSKTWMLHKLFNSMSVSLQIWYQGWGTNFSPLSLWYVKVSYFQRGFLGPWKSRRSQTGLAVTVQPFIVGSWQAETKNKMLMYSRMYMWKCDLRLYLNLAVFVLFLIKKIQKGNMSTCRLALSSCRTRSSRSWAGKWRAPTSSSPNLCRVMVILSSCG